MLSIAVVLCQAALGQAPAIEPDHASNTVARAARATGLSADGVTETLAAPTVPDGLSADAQRAALKAVAGSDSALDELLRDSVTAPFKLKIRDVSTPAGVIRVVDIWFVVHAALDEIKVEQVAPADTKPGGTEVGGMKFEARLLTEAERKARGLPPDDPRQRFVHTKAILLDKVGIDLTSHIFATTGKESVIIASETARSLDNDPEYPNRWWLIVRREGREEKAVSHPYAGSISYVKMTQLQFAPGALLVEGHVAFSEPKAWFDGAPILRSKISLVAQDQLRALRREIAKHRKEKAAE